MDWCLRAIPDRWCPAPGPADGPWGKLLGSTNHHVAGSAFIIAYLTRLVWPVIGQYALERRVPNVLLPDDPIVTHSDAVVVKDEAALYIRLNEWLFDDNLAKVIASPPILKLFDEDQEIPKPRSNENEDEE